ncbi:MAG: hypothetical protein NC408_04435 [Candidatus Gastranaerophilales bacterium]|nr:hypothetical protein [Candidatus Gastranaerophilales bacterium]MCM1072281.1 hypothetical protein [Bacteroides sp.]
MATEVTDTIIKGLYTNPVFSQLMRRNLDKQSVWYDLVNHKYEDALKSKGDRVVIYQAGDITLRDYVKGEDMTFDDPEGNKIEVELSQQKYFGFSLEDIDVKQSEIKGLGEKYIDRAQTTITLAKDSFIATKIWDGLSSDNLFESVAITKDNVYNLLTRLMARLSWASAVKANGTGYDGKRPWLVVDPDVLGVILQAPETTSATESGFKTTREGTVARLAGFDIKVSNNSDEKADTRRIIAGTTEGFAYVDQIAKTKVQPAEKRFATNYSGLYLYGGDVIQEKALAGVPVTLPSLQTGA